MPAPPIKFNQRDFTAPRGTNKLSSLAMYYQRLLYKEKIYPPDFVRPLDTWYDKQYYGKVDRVQNTISLKRSRLKVPKYAARPDVYMIDFVAAAFDDFSRHMAEATIIGIANPRGNPKLTKLRAIRSYDSSLDQYKRYMNVVYEAFQEIYPRFSDKIKDFRTFRQLYVAFLREVATAVPVTLTNYTLSSAIDIFSSGLCIAVDTGPFDKDAPKYDKYISDPNFQFYVRCAKKYGFIVNKNMPWLLTADLFSDAIMKYISAYDTDDGDPVDDINFFDHYYHQAHMMDIPLLKMFIINSYRQYIALNPFYEQRVYRGQCDKFKLVNHDRAPLPPVIEEALSDKYLSDLYLRFRSLEAAEPVQVTDKLKNELAAIYELRPNEDLTGLENVVEYINLIYRDYIYGIDYPLINDILFKNLDNQIRTGKISTVGSIVQQLY